MNFRSIELILLTIGEGSPKFQRRLLLEYVHSGFIRAKVSATSLYEKLARLYVYDFVQLAHSTVINMMPI